MSRSRSDKSMTVALCVSLVAHALIGLYIVREQIAYLDRQMSPPPSGAVDWRVALKPPGAAVAVVEEEERADVAIAPGPESGPDFPPADGADVPSVAPPVPPPLPEQAKKPKTQNDENEEWGEKDGKGKAFSSVPGKRPMQARKGVEDQAFASRDPEGPQMFPDEPSMSTATPGENGDGRKPVKDNLANQGTEGAPPVELGRPDAVVTPPPPIVDRSAMAWAANPSMAPAAPLAVGTPASELPAQEPRSPVELGGPRAEREGAANPAARDEKSTPLFPMKSPDVIAVASKAAAYPEVVDAFERSPGARPTVERVGPVAELVMPEAAAPEVESGPTVRPATVALAPAFAEAEELARRVGDAAPTDAPAVAEALTRPPGEANLEGALAAAPVAELAHAAEATGPVVREAIVPLEADRPRVEDELAQQVPPGAEAPRPVTPAAVVPAVAAAVEKKAVGGVPGPPVQAADPAPDVGLESDPFAKTPSVEFTDGEVSARSGRQVKPVRPHLTDAGKRDLFAKQFPTILAKVRIDKQGKVTDVTVVQGSGSEAIDMPVYRCLWQWYFEPPKDKAGNPLEDVQLVAIHWG